MSDLPEEITSCVLPQHAIRPDQLQCFCGFYKHVAEKPVPTNLRERFALWMPYWMWRCFSIGMKDHMLETKNLYELGQMSNYPDSMLDKKGLYVKRVAIKLIDEYKNGETKKLR